MRANQGQGPGDRPAGSSFVARSSYRQLYRKQRLTRAAVMRCQAADLPTPSTGKGSDVSFDPIAKPASAGRVLEALPDWPTRTIAVLATYDGSGPRAIPVSAPVRAGDHSILLNLHRTRIVEATAGASRCRTRDPRRREHRLHRAGARPHPAGADGRLAELRRDRDRRRADRRPSPTGVRGRCRRGPTLG